MAKLQQEITNDQLTLAGMVALSEARAVLGIVKDVFENMGLLKDNPKLIDNLFDAYKKAGMEMLFEHLEESLPELAKRVREGYAIAQQALDENKAK